MTRIPRNRTPRTFVLAELRAMRADLMTAVERWRVGRTITMPVSKATDQDLADAITPPGGYAPADPDMIRPRRPWEYPEWRLSDWHVLGRELDQLVDQATVLRAFVDEQVARLRCARCKSDLALTEARAGFKTCEHCPAVAS